MMSTVLHVANLSPTVDHRDMETLFAAHGTVDRAVIAAPGPIDRDAETGVVEMGCEAEADSAIAALHGSAYCGRLLQVAHATTRATD
jgi:hypothetical protein